MRKNFKDIDVFAGFKAQNGAEKFVSHKSQFLHGDAILVLNAGFGGLNAVLRVGRY